MDNSIYYGVYVPNDLQVWKNPGSKNVFSNKMQALEEVRKYNKARFKSFSFYHEAVEFSLYGSEHDYSLLSLDLSTSLNQSTSSSATSGEKLTRFPVPKSQDLLKFRKAIEIGDIFLVNEIIWKNPRYLISNGDTPTILQKRFRYNALHLAAKADDWEMCSLILATVSLPIFIQLLYGEDNCDNSEESSKILLDSYLNTPENDCNETPLHFAVKFGYTKVVEVLISYPQCNKHLLNKYSCAPKDIICSSLPNPSSVLKEKITNFLQEQYYVPVIRSKDKSIQPIIGEVFSLRNPPQLNQNTIESPKEIHAFAGPMTKDEAIMFRRKWKTALRSTVMQPLRVQASTPPNKYNNNAFETTVNCLQDTEKGLERLGRELARKSNADWKEYWPFLCTFADLTTEEGLIDLESYLQSQISTVDTETETATTTTIPAARVGSSVTELCTRFDAFTIADNNHGKIEQQTATNTNTNTTNANAVDDCVSGGEGEPNLTPFLHIENSFQVFANYIAYYLLFKMDTVNSNTLDTLESEMKYLKLLIKKLMENSTCKDIFDIQSVHSRIAYLISFKLQQVLTYQEVLEEKIIQLENIITKYDEINDLLSSDDEEINYRRMKSTADTKHAICLVKNILKCLNFEMESSLNANTEKECTEAWNNSLKCTCVWKTNKRRRTVSSIKTSVKKLLSKFTKAKTSENQLSVKLNLEDNEFPGKIGNMDDSDSSSDDYFSAQNSPITSDDEDNYVDTDFSKNAEKYINFFIASNVPTKVDLDIYDIIKDVLINSSKYPNIFLWKHSLESFLYEQKQKNVGSSSTSISSGRNRASRSIFNPPCDRQHASRPIFNPPCDNVRNSLKVQLWRRVVGEYSPIKN